MRKNLKLTLALGAMLALAVAGVAVAAKNKPIVIRQGNLVVTFNGGFTPTALPRHEMAPITLNVEGKLETADHTHVPALKEFVIETDKNGSLNVKGLPECKKGQLEARDSKTAKAVCKSALLGEGKTNVEVLFPESRPIQIPSTLLLFNGGQKGGVTTLYVHAYFTDPITGAVVTTVKVKKIHNGIYGYKSVASVPIIGGHAEGGGGYGSPTNFKLKIHRTFNYKGKKQSFLVAQCPTGRLGAQGEASFYADPTKLKGHVTRACTPKG
jgi:hypothetical protein